MSFILFMRRFQSDKRHFPNLWNIKSKLYIIQCFAYTFWNGNNLKDIKDCKIHYYLSGKLIMRSIVNRLSFNLCKKVIKFTNVVFYRKLSTWKPNLIVFFDYMYTFSVSKTSNALYENIWHFNYWNIDFLNGSKA